LKLAIARGLREDQVYVVHTRWGAPGRGKYAKKRRFMVFTGDLVKAIETIEGDDSGRWKKYLEYLGGVRDYGEWKRARGLRFKPVSEGGNEGGRRPRRTWRKNARVGGRELLPADESGDPNGGGADHQ